MKKTLKIVTIILTIVLIMLISFFGIFRKELNQMLNIVPKYKLGDELAGTRNFSFVVDDKVNKETIYRDSEGNVVENVDENTDTSAYTKEEKETKVNEESALTEENYKKSKKIIEDRLKKSKVSEYDIRMDNQTGKIIVSTLDTPNSNNVYNMITSAGKLEIIDDKTKEVLINNDDIKKSSVVYSTESTGTAVYLQLEFDKEGKAKLKDMSNKYVSKEVPKETATENTVANEVATENTVTNETVAENTVKSETTEENKEPETETVISYIDVNLDGTTLIKTYFADEMAQGILQVPISQHTTDVQMLNQYIQSTQIISNIINSGKMPVVYALENDNFIKSPITENVKKIGICAFEIVTAALILWMIIKNGKNGFFGGILHVGYIATVLLALRYTNVVLTLGGIVAFVFVTLINYLFLMELMKNIKLNKSKAFSNTALNNIIRYIPVIIISVVFTVITNVQINSIGMIAFWGIIIMAIYNLIFTRSLYKIED